MVRVSSLTTQAAWRLLPRQHEGSRRPRLRRDPCDEALADQGRQASQAAYLFSSSPRWYL